MIPETAEPQTLEPPPPTAPAPQPEEDTDYFLLSAPMIIPDPKGDRTIERLLLNPKKLGGRGFFALVNQFAKIHPDEYRAAFNPYNNVKFLTLVIAKLNQITPEDLCKLSYIDLPLLMLRASAFHYSGGRQATSPQVNGETPGT